jgi:hypothetical protein
MEEIWMWIARDRSGILRIYENEPKVDKRKQEIISIGGYYDININLFPQITFDNSPKKVKIELI